MKLVKFNQMFLIALTVLAVSACAAKPEPVAGYARSYTMHLEDPKDGCVNVCETMVSVDEFEDKDGNRMHIPRIKRQVWASSCQANSNPYDPHVLMGENTTKMELAK